MGRTTRLRHNRIDSIIAAGVFGICHPAMLSRVQVYSPMLVNVKETLAPATGCPQNTSFRDIPDLVKLPCQLCLEREVAARKMVQPHVALGAYS